MKKFTSIEDMEKNYNWWDKFITHPSMNWLRWTIYNLPDVPMDFYRKCKRGWQRAYFGISDEDCWLVDYYLSKVILIGLKKLRINKPGCPILDGYNGETDFDEMQKEWDDKLNSMIYAFEVTQKIQEENWMITPVNGWTEEERKRLEKNFHLMTKEETYQYLRGWANFQNHYFSLWD